MKRENNNEHDELAIMILTRNSDKLGYVSRSKNEVLTRLMDSGKLIFGKIEDKCWKGSWLKLDIKIYLRDI